MLTSGPLSVTLIPADDGGDDVDDTNESHYAVGLTARPQIMHVTIKKKKMETGLHSGEVSR